MAMFGADVIHVESTARPDGARLMNWHPPTEAAVVGVVVVLPGDEHQQARRDARPAQRRRPRLAHRLIAECDVIVENYSPRVMDRFGLSWDDVRAVVPTAMMVRMPAFGLGGPWRDRTGFAMTMEQVSGMAWISGPPEHPPGALFGPCDPSAGLHALVGLLAAIEHRRRTGEGRLVECPMVGEALNVSAEQVIEHSANGVRLDRTGNRGPPPRRRAATPAADGRRPRPAPLGGDRRRRPTSSGRRCAACSATRRGRRDPSSTRPPAGWPRTTSSTGTWPRGAPTAAPTEIVDELVAGRRPVRRRRPPVGEPDLAQLSTAGSSSRSSTRSTAPRTIVTFPFRLPGQTGPVHRRPAPLLGEHNDEVLGGLLGVPADELARLRPPASSAPRCPTDAGATVRRIGVESHNEREAR